jgi:hypothetical protein
VDPAARPARCSTARGRSRGGSARSGVRSVDLQLGQYRPTDGGGNTTTAVDAANSLIVNSDPAGARVTVDGIGWGTTPATIRMLTPGEKTIRVIKDGYASEERRVRIIDGRSTSVHVPLRTAAK